MKYRNLQSKLLVRIVFVLLGFGAVLFFSVNYFTRVLMETEVADKARLVFANLLAVQTYVRENLRPTMYSVLPEQEFVIEAMSTSYVTRKVMSDLNTARDQFSYRRVALDPRNPKYAATEMESEFIAYFRENPDEQQLSSFRIVDGSEAYVSARPVIYKQNCLVCHGKPEDAPAVMLARYGSERGFGRTENEIGGLDMLIMPVDNETAALRKVSLSFILLFGCGTLAIIGLNYWFFDRVTILNFSKLASALKSRFPAEANIKYNKGSGKSDEIEEMIEDIEHFADHLKSAREQLSDYAANLEAKVEQRTSELKIEAEARLADVQLFLDVLELFSRNLDRKALLNLILELVVKRFGSQGAVFHCFLTMNSHSWPQDVVERSLTPAKREQLLDGIPIVDENKIIVPVQAIDSIRGALALYLPENGELPSQEREVLSAIGKQLGLTLENLEAMENILLRKTILESIFEGIADPLFLLDQHGIIVYSNEAAKNLLKSLAGTSEAKLLGFSELSRELETTDAPLQKELTLPGGRSLIIRSYALEGYGGSGKAIVYARDNTVEKTMLAGLQQSEKALAVGKLAAGLAHEINNPLGVILCYAQLISSVADDDQIIEDTKIIIRHTQQAQKVLQDLMRFARPKPEAIQYINPAEAAQFIARVFQVRAAQNNIVITTHFPEDFPCIMGNMDAMEQILTNLIINSIDALDIKDRPYEGRIDIKGSILGASGEVVITIADNGPGISEEYLSRVFDPFFTTKDVGKGTGLGLSVVYGLVRDLEGSIRVENNNGAEFTMTFKVQECSYDGNSEPRRHSHS